MLIENTDASGLVTATVLNIKISEVENQILNVGGLVITTVVNSKISEVENKTPNHDKNLLLLLNLIS